MSNEHDRREAIDKVASDWRKFNNERGVPMTQEQARERVSEGVRQGDRKRSERNDSNR